LALPAAFHFRLGDEMGMRALHGLQGQEFAHAMTCNFFGREGGVWFHEIVDTCRKT